MVKSSSGFKVGDVVIKKEDNMSPSMWKLGHVELIHLGNDGIVRIVTVRITTGLFKRAVRLN